MIHDEGTIDLGNRGTALRTVPVNGHGAVAEVAQMADPDHGRTAAGELAGVEWYPSYDRASVEQHLAELEAERTRLDAEIADAERRTAEAEEALAARTAELEAGLGAVVLAARAELVRLEREQEEAVAAIRAEADAEAARIREAARLEAATVRDATASLAAAGPTGGEWSRPAPGPDRDEDRPDAH